MSFYSYHSYLLRGSLLGNLYRNFLLYPFLLRCLGSRTFLDVGCGIGMFLSRGSNFSVGLDVNPHNINYISKYLSQKAFCVSPDNPSFPLADASFSYIVCDQVLEHIVDPSPLLSEINRVSSLNSKLLIGLPMKKGFLADPDHKRFYDLQTAVSLVSDCTDFHFVSSFIFPLPFAFFGGLFSWQYLYIIFAKEIL